MASFKVAFVVLLAFGAFECQSASTVAGPEPRDMNIFLAAQNVITIARNVIAAIDKGIEESRPSIEILIKQLTPELGQFVKELLIKVKGKIDEEKERIEFVIKEVEELLDAIKKIKSCTDQEKKNIDRVLGNLENGLLDAYKKTRANQSKPVEDMVAGYKRIVSNVRKVFDTEIKAVAVCIKPGSPNAKKCLENEIEKIKKAVIGIAADAFMFYSEVKDVVMNFATELLSRGKPMVDKFIKDVDPITKKVSDCTAKLK